MRRDADAGVRAVVDDDVATQEVVRDGLAVRHVEDHGAAALRIVYGRVDGVAGARGVVDDAARQPQRLLADRRDADRRDDLVAGARRVERRDVRRAALKPLRALGIDDGTGGKCERLGMRRPADQAGFERSCEVRPDVEIPCARPAAQPLDRSADGEIGLERRDVERHRAGRLIDVENDVRSDAMRLLDDGPCVLDTRAPEENERERHEHGPLVDGIEQAVEVVPDRVVRCHVHNLGTVAREALEQVHVGRELELGQDDFAPRTIVAKTGRDDPHHDRHVLVHRDRASRHAEDRRQEIAGRPADFPPAFVPRPHAAPAPGVGVLLEVRRRPARHRAERVAHEIGAVVNGGELVAPAGQRITGQ